MLPWFSICYFIIARTLLKVAEDIIIHSDQHHNYALSGGISENPEIPEATINYRVGSGSHAFQAGKMLGPPEPELLSLSPGWVLLYGDTNSTLAGMLKATKLDSKGSRPAECGFSTPCGSVVLA
jgi:UDP-N-acetylglucosamine 2-epimerase